MAPTTATAFLDRHASPNGPAREPPERATQHDQRQSPRPSTLDALRRLLGRLRVQQLRRRGIRPLSDEADKQEDDVGGDHTRDHRK